MITQGKWVLEHNDQNGTVKIWAGSAIEERHTGQYDSAGEMELYDCCYLEGDNDEENASDLEMLANARAISCVPDMIEALQDLIKQWEEFDYDQSALVLDKARAALEKAGINGEHMKGRGND